MHQIRIHNIGTTGGCGKNSFAQRRMPVSIHNLMDDFDPRGPSEFNAAKYKGRLGGVFHLC